MPTVKIGDLKVKSNLTAQLLRRVYRFRMVVSAVVWFEVRSFFAALEAGRPVLGRIPEPLPPLPQISRLGTKGVFALPIRCPFRWHPVQHWRLIYAAVGSIRPADRVDWMLAKELPVHLQDVLNPFSCTSARAVFGAKNRTGKNPRPGTSVRETGGFLSVLKNRRNKETHPSGQFS